MKSNIIFFIKVQVLTLFLGLALFTALYLAGDPLSWDVIWQSMTFTCGAVAFAFLILPLVEWWFNLGE